MNVRNCRKCGKLFNHIMGMPVCPACREKLEQKFQEVKKYIRENRMSGIIQQDGIDNDREEHSAAENIEEAAHKKKPQISRLHRT